jgi:hypothetical protein
VVAVSLEDYVVVDGLCVINVSLLWTPPMFDVMATCGGDKVARAAGSSLVKRAEALEGDVFMATNFTSDAAPPQQSPCPGPRLRTL